MKKGFVLQSLICLLAVSCSVQEIDTNDPVLAEDDVFYASLESDPKPDTKVYLDMIDEKPVPPVVHGDFEIVAAGSCGCSEDDRPDTIRERYFRQTRFLRSFYLLQGQLAEELFEANSLKDLTAAVLRNRAIFGCNDIFLCFNDCRVIVSC